MKHKTDVIFESRMLPLLSPIVVNRRNPFPFMRNKKIYAICLRSNVPQKTEIIRIISIVGRYLEHSRIYMFGTGKEQKMYIASADLMTRNTLKRVEVAAPVYDEDIRKQISYMFSTMLSDNVQAREMQSDGTYIRVKNHRKRINSQELFGRLAYEKSEQRKLTLE